MRVLSCFLTIGAALLCSTAWALPELSTCAPVPFRPGETPDRLPLEIPRAEMRADTAWFGGDDGQGIAFEGGLWDFDQVHTDPFQGWRSTDLTANPGDYFARVTEADFAAHGDPCVPIQPGNTGMLWCGIHEDEADLREFVAGMGYQNLMCQRAFSPEWAIDPVVDAIDLSFLYFNHSEPNYDYTYVELLCRDAVGELIDTYSLAVFDGVIGDPAALAAFGAQVPAGTLDPATATIQLELRMESDWAWSDEDGQWDTPCGPFGLDDLALTIGATAVSFDFEDGPQGWTFSRCPGTGTFMAVHPEGTWSAWIDEAGVACACPLSENALGFVDVAHSPYWPPGLVPTQVEQAVSGVVPREGYGLPEWNTVVVDLDAFDNFARSTGGLYRPGWMMYPYTTEAIPVPHWSGRHGQEMWFYTSSPTCRPSLVSLSTMDDEPLPAEWDSLKFVYEVCCSCAGFGIPSTVCTEEGNTGGSPLLDNIRVGLTLEPNAPHLGIIMGGLFMDSYGQNYPTYLEPSDRGNSNISFDLSMGGWDENDWHGDSSALTGPLVTSESLRWLAQLCFRIPRTGARQDLVTEYHAWKARLAGDPEQGFVCVLMDSLETNNHTQIWRHKFATYFHEDADGFDPGHPDYSEAQEILPDGVLVPGTRVEYYYRSYWYNGGAPPDEFYVLGPWEYEILPTMTLIPGEEYEVQWPCVLFVDAFNRGSEPLINAMLTEAGLSFDRFDYLDAAGCCNASLKRDYGGTTGHNPGGYGNNGLTTQQLLGYRLVLFHTGTFGVGAVEPEDWDLFEEWLASTDCAVANIRRGLLLDGDGICEIGADPVNGLALDFVHNVLGAELVARRYGDHNNDDAYCVYLEPTASSVFTPLAPGIGLYGSGCPQEFNYNVIGLRPGVPGAVGNLRFYSYGGTGTEPYVDYAQVVRQNVQPGTANWMSVLNGFSLHHLSERGCAGEDCSHDSACVVAGGLDLLRPLLDWMQDPGDPFVSWRYPCEGEGVEEQPATHLSGPVDYLHASRPNPFFARATIRFSLARAGRASLEIYDVGGRRVRTLMDGERKAGEQTVVWDGCDDRGRPVGAGVFWVQLRTAEGYASARRMLVLR